MSPNGKVLWGQSRLGVALHCTQALLPHCPIMVSELEESTPLQLGFLTILITGAVPLPQHWRAVMTDVVPSWHSTAQHSRRLQI